MKEPSMKHRNNFQSILLTIFFFLLIAAPAGIAEKLKKDGTPDMRYSENQIKYGSGNNNSYSAPIIPPPTVHLKKDGTPDRRYNENKVPYRAPTTTYSPPTPTVHLKKDGTPDKRYNENKVPYSAPSTAPTVHLKKDG